jgi:hypothetical protein
VIPIAVKLADTAGETVVFATTQLTLVVDATVAPVMEYPVGKPPCKILATSVQFAIALVPALVELMLLEA